MVIANELRAIVMLSYIITGNSIVRMKSLSLIVHNFHVYMFLVFVMTVMLGRSFLHKESKQLNCDLIAKESFLEQFAIS